MKTPPDLNSKHQSWEATATGSSLIRQECEPGDSEGAAEGTGRSTGEEHAREALLEGLRVQKRKTCPLVRVTRAAGGNQQSRGGGRKGRFEEGGKREDGERWGVSRQPGQRKRRSRDRYSGCRNLGSGPTSASGLLCDLGRVILFSGPDSSSKKVRFDTK